MRTCIVRIYREEGEGSHSLVGVVEEVGREGRRAFSNLEELWESLRSREENNGAHREGNGRRKE